MRLTGNVGHAHAGIRLWRRRCGHRQRRRQQVSTGAAAAASCTATLISRKPPPHRAQSSSWLRRDSEHGPVDRCRCRQTRRVLSREVRETRDDPSTLSKCAFPPPATLKPSSPLQQGRSSRIASSLIPPPPRPPPPRPVRETRDIAATAAAAAAAAATRIRPLDVPTTYVAL